MVSSYAFRSGNAPDLNCSVRGSLRARGGSKAQNPDLWLQGGVSAVRGFQDLVGL